MLVLDMMQQLKVEIQHVDDFSSSFVLFNEEYYYLEHLLQFTICSLPRDLFTASCDLRLVNVKEGNLACR